MTTKPRINDPTCRKALAGEYVLGTLQGRARRRFGRLLSHSPDLQLYVAQWQRALAPLAGELEPVRPPRRVWRNIESQIRRPRSNWWDSLPFWRSFGAAAAALLVVLTLVPGTDWRATAPADYVFVVQGDRGQVQWVMTASAGSPRLYIRPVQPPGVGPERLCRLWWYPKDGAPRALAVLPEGGEGVQVHLPEGFRDRIRADEMAVTIAPADRAPGAGPVGEEVFRGRWVPMT
ncbi:MAG TPA: anti-sigma factor [Gammaproteobacteria bacterium]|nr:anti-sigma factor [Gammaproteobacteria bacterium]